MGASREGFAQAIVEVVPAMHRSSTRPAMDMRPSKAGNYLSLTCTVRATSKAQLDALYRELTGHPWVKIVL